MSTPTLYAVRDDGAELWDTGEPSLFPGDPGMGYIVADGKQYEPRPILALTARGSWSLVEGDGPVEGKGFDPGQPRDRLGRFTEVPGSGLADFMTHARDTSPDPVDLAKIKVTGTENPDVFRINRGLPRAEMPQVPNAHKPKFLAAMQDMGVKVTKEQVDPATLHPVQGQIDARRAGEMIPFNPATTADNPITISSDNYVLDGHHRWAAAVAERGRIPDLTMTAYRVDLPIDELLAVTAAWNEDADIQRRVFGDAKAAALLTPEEKREAFTEFKKIWKAKQRHGGWLWAGRPGGGDTGGAPSLGRHQQGVEVPDVTADGEDVSRRQPIAHPASVDADKPDVIEVVDPYGDTIKLNKHNSMWHHLERKPDGSWGFTPEREALHRQIILDTLAGVPRSKNPTLYMLGGGPAAGKTTMIKSGQVDYIPTWGENGSARDAVMVNADDVKAALPEYDDGKGAGFVHEESSWVSKQIQKAAQAGKRDIILDGTGDSKIVKLTAKIEDARGDGYKVRGVYATTSIEEALRRAEYRRKEEGREVAANVVIDGHQAVSRTFPAGHDLFDDVVLYDTTDSIGKNGSPPVLVATGSLGAPLTVHDQDRYDAFVSKAVADVDPLLALAADIKGKE